jgi:hypothetical protein
MGRAWSRAWRTERTLDCRQCGVLHAWALEAALAHGDLPMAVGTARDLPSVDLARATQLLVLMASERSPRYGKAAVRWLSRYAAEGRHLTPADLADVAEALGALERGDFDARERLLSAVEGRS